MKKILFVIMLMATGMANAQVGKLDKYPMIPAEYDETFVDYVKDFNAGMASIEFGEYFGQITEDKSIYGFGALFTEKDGVIYGQYRNGQFMFGIKVGEETALVGNNNHYICYDLTTGDPLYIYKDGEKYSLPKDFRNKNKFLTLTYGNGEKYVGEVVDGKREGFGLYYYNTGAYFYGKYVNNNREGIGVTFDTTNNIYVQYYNENLF